MSFNPRATLTQRAGQAKNASIFKILPPRPAKTNFLITDFFTNIDEVTKPTFLDKSTTKSKIMSFLTGFHVLNPTTCLALILLGMISAIFAFIIEIITENLISARAYITDTGYWGLDFVLWISFSLVFAYIAASVGKYIHSDAEGIGIPEMKSILSGVRINRFLSFKIFFAKVIGYISAFAAGLSIGSEGPYVHISGIIANKLTKLSLFRHLHTVINI